MVLHFDAAKIPAQPITILTGGPIKNSPVCAIAAHRAQLLRDRTAVNRRVCHAKRAVFGVKDGREIFKYYFCF